MVLMWVKYLLEGWQKVIVIVTCILTGVWCLICFFSGGVGFLWFDDIHCSIEQRVKFSWALSGPRL